ncbi:MAG: NADH-quinone oxidoreductase subunit NuoG [Ardenticatenaceae bacterium]|nr:NADH-quinone oxidoreductase subunit NuoG [Ardenticatenaceae bacterium]
MSDLVTIFVDGIELQVEQGATVVDASKRVDVDIPVFCHHPKLEPVGMCRMCLVEIGMPMRDRATGEPVLEEDGSPQINWGRGLQTGCTVRVADGMRVRTTTDVVDEARENVIEFLLTSHPLDCPICDKGGECPLQNLTMAHGLGESAFDFDSKMQNEKHVPLGELIFLDRERCIQCARCTRFQDEIADDPVIGFHNRGRALEIVTLSDPGFDSYWSGNTTDICPVGALTTADFRFGARPWELIPVASISPHGPEGANITMSTRQEAKSGGRVVIKRIMPRQNELVNEIWISDHTRFVHHFADAADRLTKPLIRKGGVLVETDWDTALTTVAEKLQAAGSSAAGLSGDRPSNEDLFAFQKLFRQGLKSHHIDLAASRIAGGDVTAQVGIASGSNLLDLGRGDVIVVVASDLHEEAPIWWLRVKQAAERGAQLVVLNVRPTRLDKFATHLVHYPVGEAVATVRQLLGAAQISDGASDQIGKIAEAIVGATNVVAFYGYEGLTYAETDVLAKSLANLLQVKNSDGHSHVGRVNNGLIAVWPHNNTQGAWDMGIHPALAPGYQSVDQPGRSAAEIYSGVQDGTVQTLFVMAADPVGDGLMNGRGLLDFLVVQELFLTETAKVADVVLPAQSWAERDGTFTNGERRVQRYYPAIQPVGESRPDWQIIEQIGHKMGLDKPHFAASLVFKKGIAAGVPQYSDMDYRSIAKVEKQYPDVGGEDLYYGGTSYENKHGLGQQWTSAAESGDVAMFTVPDVTPSAAGALPVIRTAALYTPGTLINRSDVLSPRMAQPTLHLHAADADRLSIATGDAVIVSVNGQSLQLSAHVNGAAPQGLALINGVSYAAGVLDAKIETA